MSTSRRDSGRYTPPKPKTRWILYLRLSIGDPNLERDAARQRAEGLALVKRLGGVVVAELGHNDRSASEFATSKRSDYAEAMRMIDRGEADAIVFSRVDRILRRMNECLDLLRRVRDTGLEVWNCSEDEEMRLNTPIGRKRLQDMVNTAEYETAQISWRVKRSTAARREANLPSACGSYGWADSTTVDAKEAKIVKQMATRVLRGESLDTVAAWLNSKGVPRRKSKLLWDGTAVGAVLRAPRNYGLAAEYVPPPPRDTPDEKRTEVWRAHRAARKVAARKVTPLAEGIVRILPTEWYGQMLDTIEGRTRSTRPRHAMELAGLVHCAECGHPLLRSSSSQATGARPILQCRRQHKNPGRCGAGNIDWKITLSAIKALVTEAVDKTELADLVAPAAGVDSDAVRAELAHLERQLSEATDEWLAFPPTITKERFDLIESKVKARREELTGMLAQQAQASVLREYAGQPGALAKRWDKLSPEVLRQVIGEALKNFRIVVDKPKKGQPGALGFNQPFNGDDPKVIEAVQARIRLEDKAA
jgi:site-specific DNA recombinase